MVGCDFPFGLPRAFVDALGAVSRLRGHLLTLRDFRYIDTAAIDTMVAALQEAHERVGTATGRFLADEKALAPFQQRLGDLDARAQKAASARELAEAIDAMQGMAGELDMLSELMATLRVDDATQRTRVVDALSAIYAKLNQTRARATQRRRELGSAEAVAQFGAQFALFGLYGAGKQRQPENSSAQNAFHRDHGCFPGLRREIDGFYVLYTAAAVKVAKGKKGRASCCGFDSC